MARVGTSLAAVATERAGATTRLGVNGHPHGAVVRRGRVALSMATAGLAVGVATASFEVGVASAVLEVGLVTVGVTGVERDFREVVGAVWAWAEAMMGAQRR